MKKIILPIITAVALIASSCGGLMGNGTGLGLGGLGTGTGTNTGLGGGLGNVLGNVLGGLANANTANSLLNMVIGGVKISQDQLVGTWYYSAPGCAFTSDKLLAKAGGAVAAGQVKEKLQSVYNSVGISSNNTAFAFDANGKFQANIKGIPLSGTYTYDPSTCAIKMKATLLTLTGYVTRTTNGMALTFESKKLLTVFQAATALTGNSTLSTVGDISKQFDGVRVGFELSK